MTVLLIIGVIVALLGFVLLLRPEPLWRLVCKDKELTGPMAALLRLVGIGVLFLSVAIVQMVG